ncbi:MAG: 50S ribosomal protein L1, partial [Cyanobacteria bacterium P01_F01_bin.3]
MAKISKRMSALYEKVDDQKDYQPDEAVALLKETATAKFVETAEAHIRLGIDPKYTDQQLRTTVALPKGTGQDVRVAVVARGEKVTAANEACDALEGSEVLFDVISLGMMDFDVLVATPDMMPIGA